ncbi:MAG: hypothetical protein A2927_02125 [Candidatus Komeilibacteria bacterium RIFCSPLOWO2_01_FULL_45_10]|uniref:Amino acid transporter transmembrane domain-containing protein n=1 Tax=Candidatus Komeilibacteria bacterium RIFCSPLOWO2_01_FULL_45_10 TaxID=1798550 RepID=A0A1G2BJG5_9BACT|nr:MAG: hypothetical protein A2927_02125 [Candidatus Komeilibacteria bacterium RIFCSPLOWO2_01_FULL_45_10]
MKKELPFLEAIAVLVGTIIGAGILGIPYVAYRAGFLTTIIVMTVIYLAVLLINLHIGEIVLSTKKLHQLTGYAEKYLGKWGKTAMFFSVIIGFYGALLAYLIGEGEVLAALTGGSPIVYSLLFFVFGSVLVYLGLTIVKRTELFMTFLILLLVILVFILGLDNLEWENLAGFDLAKIFLPYGVIFFAMGGASAIPQLAEVLHGREKLVKRAIIIGTTIPFAVYLIFTFIAVGVTGANVTEVATVGLGRVMGKSMLAMGNVFAFFTMATSFLTLGLALKKTYHLDFGVNKKLAWLLTISLPLLMLFLGLNHFVGVLGTAGAIGGGLEGLLIGLIYLQLKKKRENVPAYQLTKSPLIIILLSLMFIGGIVYTLWYF